LIRTFETKIQEQPPPNLPLEKTRGRDLKPHSFLLRGGRLGWGLKGINKNIRG